MGEEKAFEDKIKRFLKARGVYFVKFFANRMTKTGVPDILACVRGRWVAIEVKAANGRASPLQLWNREEIRRAGGIAIVLYPHQFDEFKELIRLIEEGEFEHYMQFRFD